MTTLTLDEKIEELNQLCDAHKHDDQFDELCQQRAELLAKRYPVWKDKHKQISKPSNPVHVENIEYVDYTKLMVDAVAAGKVFALVHPNEYFTHVFFIGGEIAVIVKVPSGSRGKVYNMFEATVTKARQQYRDLIGQGYHRAVDEVKIAAAAVKKFS